MEPLHPRDSAKAWICLSRSARLSFFRGQQRSSSCSKNDAEISFCQLLFDVFSECIQARTLIDSKENIKNFWDQLLHPHSRFRSEKAERFGEV